MAAAGRRGQPKQSLRAVDDPRHGFGNDPRVEGPHNKKNKRKDVQQYVHLPDATAAAEAAARANHSRGLGNVVHFCRWRQIERMINLLTAEDPGEITIH